MISANKIVGSLVYRTGIDINANRSVFDTINSYEFAPSFIESDRINFSHLPGTPNEISNIFIEISKHPKGKYLKYPSLLNFQPIEQRIEKNSTIIYLNLAFVAPVKSEWTTSQREIEVFDKVLRPLYASFMSQVAKCRYFELGFGMIPHDKFEVFTTGDNSGSLLNRYGDYIDAIEVHNLRLRVKQLCDKDIDIINYEDGLNTENIKQILNSK